MSRTSLRGAALGVGLAAAALVATWPAAVSAAEGRLARVMAAGAVRVCIWPDYYAITYRNPKSGALSGVDVTLSQELARDLGVGVSYVETSFPKFMDDLLVDRCDVAMFGVAVLPERAERVRFTDPYLRSGILAVTTKDNPRVRSWADIDREGHVVAVQAGTFMEPVMRRELARAELMVVRPPDTREREVQSGRADAFMTDYPYSRRLMENADWARLLTPPQPLNPLGYAYAAAPGDEAWLARLDAFVAAIKRDGRLVAAAKAHGLDPIVVLD